MGGFGGIGTSGSGQTFPQTLVNPPFLPRALKYDPSIRRWALTNQVGADTSGTLIDIHPIDQIVALRLFIEKGSVLSNPNMGNRFRARVQRVNPLQIQSIAEDEVQGTLSDLITNGDIQLMSIRTDNSIQGRVILEVNYVNLRNPGTNPSYPTNSPVTVSVQ